MNFPARRGTPAAARLHQRRTQTKHTMKTKPPRDKKPDARIAPSHRVSSSEANHSEPTAKTEPQPAPAGNALACPGWHLQMIAPGKVRVATVNAAFADRLKALAFTRLERTVTVVVQRYELTVDVLNMTDTGRMDFNALLKGVVRV